MHTLLYIWWTHKFIRTYWHARMRASRRKCESEQQNASTDLQGSSGAVELGTLEWLACMWIKASKRECRFGSRDTHLLLLLSQGVVRWPSTGISRGSLHFAGPPLAQLWGATRRPLHSMCHHTVCATWCLTQSMLLPKHPGHDFPHFVYSTGQPLVQMIQHNFASVETLQSFKMTACVGVHGVQDWNRFEMKLGISSPEVTRPWIYSQQSTQQPCTYLE